MSKHLIIVGGGIIGLTSAYYCLRDGHSVTILESGAAGHDCCARGNAGMIVPSHFVPLAAPGMVGYGLRAMADPKGPFHIRPRLDWRLADWGMNFIYAATTGHVQAASPLLRDLSLASRQSFAALSREKGFHFGLQEKGLLMLCRTAHGLAEEHATAREARELGIEADCLGPEETARLEPHIDMDICGSVYFPNDCHLDPGALLAALTSFLHEHGAVFRWKSTVRNWSVSDGRIQAAVTADGPVEGDEFILAGGAQSPSLSERIGLHLPMQAGKGYSLTLPHPPQRPRICGILTEARVAVTPIGDQLRLGGTMEITGTDSSINPERVRGIIESALRYYPALSSGDFDGIAPWSGLRPCSPDGLPYLGRTRLARNLVIATGHAMLGLSLAPITGQLVAAHVSDRPPPIESPLLSPDRYLGF